MKTTAWLGCIAPKMVLAVAFTLAPIATAGAQSGQAPDHLTREQTVEVMSQAVADIQSAFPTIAQASSLEPAMVKGILVRATTMVLELRDTLANNPYLRVSSFAVDFPSGVTVEFSFPGAVDKGE